MTVTGKWTTGDYTAKGRRIGRGAYDRHDTVGRIHKGTYRREDTAWRVQWGYRTGRITKGAQWNIQKKAYNKGVQQGEYNIEHTIGRL